MPATLVPDEAIPGLAAQVDSPDLLRTLNKLQDRGFIQNGGLDRASVTALNRLAELGLADAGYDVSASGEPFIWVSNHNGTRVLNSFLANFNSRVTIQPRAQTALASLPEEDRQAVLAMVEALQAREPASWSSQEATRVSPDKPVYLLRVTPELRAFIRVEDGGLELFDIVREDTLRLFLERYRTGSKVG
jgi:hypothetical protein